VSIMVTQSRGDDGCSHDADISKMAFAIM